MNVSFRRTEEQQEFKRENRRKVDGLNKRKSLKRKGVSTDRQRPNNVRELLFKEAGLPSKGFRTLSQRNKAKRLAQVELDPDRQEIINWDFTLSRLL